MGLAFKRWVAGAIAGAAAGAGCRSAFPFDDRIMNWIAFPFGGWPSEERLNEETTMIAVLALARPFVGVSEWSVQMEPNPPGVLNGRLSMELRQERVCNPELRYPKGRVLSGLNFNAAGYELHTGVQPSYGFGFTIGSITSGICSN